MSLKTVYAYNDDFRYIGETMVQESPLEPGIWLMPSNATEIAPPPAQSGYLINFNKTSNSWEYTLIPQSDADAKAQLLCLKNEFGIALNYLDEDYNVIAFTEEQIAQMTEVGKKTILRNIREPLLTQVDILINDLVLGELADSKKSAILAYRQALKDITNGVNAITDLNNIVWPVLNLNE